ncbi:MAG: PD-(D/E)XK nuclease family protein [Planctomycetota bacterium]|jgi:ATP-dependent helicase/nuclease subunit B
MAVRFILGRSGTGKTSYCIKAAIKGLQEPDEQPLVLLVPEQATYQAERAILSDTSVAGYHRLHVLSFDRLAFLLSGKNTARPALTRIGQQMIIHKLLRQARSELNVFGTSANWTGLGQQMARTIQELHEYAKTPEDIEGLLAELRKDQRQTMAALKFADIGLVFDRYLQAIEDRFADPDLQLRQACSAVAQADCVKGARLWVDGFAGFTAGELTILAQLLKTAAQAEIALCLDPSGLNLTNPDTAKLEPASLFGPTEQTYAALVEIIKKCKLELAEPVILSEPARYSQCPGLAHLEQNIFEAGSARSGPCESIRIVAAPNARSEVQFVARQIVQLVREKNYRYRDIAVIASDLDSYQHYVIAYFHDYQIPFFIDARKPLNQHPVVELICSALQTINGGLCHHDIFAYLKTDLVPEPRCEVDLLENYCLAFGIGPADWQNDENWHFAGDQDTNFDERHINQMRRNLSGPLLRLKNKLSDSQGRAQKITAAQLTRIVFDFMDELQVHQTLVTWSEQARAGDYSQVEEHRQLYDKLVTVFDEMVEVFAEQKLDLDDYLAVLNLAFSQLTLAFIPPTLDQVLVGSIERSRHPDLKAAFLVGATQRQFPVPVSAAGILTDDDRRAAQSADFSLAASTRQKLGERQYLAYIAFTRPSQLLCVTYPLLDQKNSPQCRSQFVDSLESLFENLKEESLAAAADYSDNIHNETDLVDLLCDRLGADAPRDAVRDSQSRYAALLEELGKNEQFAPLGSQVASAIDYDNRARLDGDVVEKLFGAELQSSATRLSTFAACPYQYFARYTLDLKKRKEFKFEPLDLGNFYHRVLDRLFKRLKADGKDLAMLPDQQLIELLKEQILQFVQTDSFISNFMRHAPHNTFIINSAAEVLEDCVLAVAKMVRAGSFRPSRSEVAFGRVKDAADSLGQFKMQLSNGRTLTLNGKIDRIDLAKIDGKRIAIVLDYKRRPTTFSWSKFYYGLDMQLPIYMLAVRSSNDIDADVIGAFYMPVEVGPERTTIEELTTESFDYKAKGIFDGRFCGHIDSQVDSGWSKLYNFRITKKDGQYGNYGTSGALKPADFDQALRFAEKKTAELAKAILSGNIDVNPYRLGTGSPCSYCDYKSVCRFDWQVNNYNPLESLNKVAALKNISATDE